MLWCHIYTFGHGERWSLEWVLFCLETMPLFMIGFCLQFGKAEEGKFSLDFQPSAISAVQAFAIALTKFGR